MNFSRMEQKDWTLVAVILNVILAVALALALRSKSSGSGGNCISDSDLIKDLFRFLSFFSF